VISPIIAEARAGVLEFELAAGLQSQLRQIATRFGVSAEVALREFVRFLEIKHWAQDSEHTKISPTPLMDAVWHAALLETKLYERIEAHIGMRLHHSVTAAATDAVTSAAREERLTAMRQLYKLRYNEQPVEPIAPPSPPVRHAAWECLSCRSMDSCTGSKSSRRTVSKRSSSASKIRRAFRRINRDSSTRGRKCGQQI
jgi:hypothetical protein